MISDTRVSKRAGGSCKYASDSDPSRRTVAPALRAILSMAVFSVSAWMNIMLTPRLRASITARSNSRAP